MRKSPFLDGLKLKTLLPNPSSVYAKQFKWENEPDNTAFICVSCLLYALAGQKTLSKAKHEILEQEFGVLRRLIMPSKKALSKLVVVIIAAVIVFLAFGGFRLWQIITFDWSIWQQGKHYHLVWDSGWVVPHEASFSNYTGFFNVSSYQWYLKWVKWEGPVNASTRLLAWLYDSSDHLVDAFPLSTAGNTELFAKTYTGMFKLVLNSNATNSGPDAYRVVLEVWEPD